MYYYKDTKNLQHWLFSYLYMYMYMKSLIVASLTQWCLLYDGGYWRNG